MADVIPFQRPEPPDPHCTGEARCVACGHRWEGVAPVGTRWLECSECGTMKGTWYNAVEASVGDTEYSCAHCGSIAMTAFKRRGLTFLICFGCGVDHTDALFGE